MFSPEDRDLSTEPFHCNADGCNFHCDNCERMVEHIREHHNTDPMINTFETTEDTFRRITAIKIDKTGIEELNPLKYRCSYCDELFTEAEDHAIHMISHLTEKLSPDISFFFNDILRLYKTIDKPTVQNLFPETQVAIFDTLEEETNRFRLIVGREAIETIEEAFPPSPPGTDRKPSIIITDTCQLRFVPCMDEPPKGDLGILTLLLRDFSAHNIPIKSLNNKELIADKDIDYSPDFVEGALANAEEHDTTNSQNNNGRYINSAEKLTEFLIQCEDYLTNIKTLEDLERFYTTIKDYRVNKEVIAEDTPIFVYFLVEEGKLPKPGLRCPLESYEGHEDKAFESLRKLCDHFKGEIAKTSFDPKVHTIDIWVEFLAQAYGTGTFVYKDENGNIDLDTHVFKCPYADCSYTNNDRSKLMDHMKTKKHAKNVYIERYGFFWGIVIEGVNRPKGIVYPTLKDIKEHACRKCPEAGCNTYVTELSDIKEHLKKKHKSTTAGVDGEIAHTDATYCWITKEELDALHAERARERAEQVDNTPVQQIINADNNEENNENQEDNGNNEEADALDPPNNTTETEDEAVHAVIINPPATEEEEVAIIAEARRNIPELQQAEERGCVTPKMTSLVRLKLLKGGGELFNKKLTPLATRYAATGNTEADKIKVDYLTLKCNAALREMIYTNNHSEPKFMTAENGEDTGEDTAPPPRISEDTRDRIQKAANEIKGTLIKVVKHISHARCLKDSTRDDEHNKFVEMIAKIKNDLRDNKFEQYNIEEIFQGPISDQSILNIVNMEDNNEFIKKMDYINRILGTPQDASPYARKKLQACFADNPTKTLRNIILADKVPQQSLKPSEYLDYYGPQWANEAEGYENFLHHDYALPERYGQAFANDFLDFMTNESKIIEVIRNKNHLSAHGLDGIPNSVYMLFPVSAAKFLSILFRSIIISGHIPDCWKLSKTVMLFKKDDPSLAKNWRPIGITSCTYRIFMTLVNKALQMIPMFHAMQKGFVRGATLSEHIAVANEVLCQSTRTQSEMFQTAIDFTNAFGTVPHQLIFDSLEAKKVPDSIINLLKDLYKGARTAIYTRHAHSEIVPVRRGVIQGCPLSPILFNCCLDPLLYAVQRRHFEDGYRFQDKAGQYSIAIQAYADDVLVISPTHEGMQRILNTVDEFQKIAKLKVAPQKCVTLAKTSTAIQPFRIGPDEIPIKTSMDNITYLGIPISGTKTSRFAAATGILEKVKAQIRVVFASHLALSQKIIALRVFILPQLDFYMFHNVFRVNDLKATDQMIRGLIDKEAPTSNIPVSFFYMPKNKGGFGLVKLELRQPQLVLTKFARLWLSQQAETKAFFHTMAQEEKSFRKVVEDQENGFLGIKMENGKIVQKNERSKRTNCFITQAAKAADKLEVRFKEWDKGGIQVRGVGENATDWYRSKHIGQISPLIGRVIQQRQYEEFKKDETHSHTFCEPAALAESHDIMKRPQAVPNNLYSAAIALRTNTAPTPANMHFHNPEVLANCPLCGCQSCTLFHTLNMCRNRFSLYKWRHNIICDDIYQFIHDHYPGVTIKCSARITSDGYQTTGPELDDTVKDLLPDLVVYDEANKMIKIIEVTCPYGTDNNVGNSLDAAYDKKVNKYKSLAEQTERLFNWTTTLSIIVVSSLGVIPLRTKLDALRISPADHIQLLKRLSMHAIAASACIVFEKVPEFFGMRCRPLPGRVTAPNAAIPPNNNENNNDTDHGQENQQATSEEQPTNNGNAQEDNGQGEQINNSTEQTISVDQIIEEDAENNAIEQALDQPDEDEFLN
ncbi:ribonuclease H protein family [Trichomonas vaginalis G3]|nr:ribonuclease H protein family [Trichomonas vaginalis G3]KAI5489050.1 ribonuclease H protein family [Trichomonas vaginalis G3]